MKNKRGISLIVLAITIIVMIILASAIILALSGNGVIFKTNKARFQNDMATMKEELSVYISNKKVKTNGAYNSDNLNANKDSLVEEDTTVEGKTILDVIKSMDKKYLDKIEIVNGRLRYTGSNIDEIKWSDEILEGIRGYELEELKVEQTNTIKLENSINTNLANYRIYGNSVQNGTPTPETTIEVESVGERTVNLVKDVREVFAGYAAYTELEEDSRQCIRFQSNNYTEYNLDFKENTQYTISCWSKCVKRPGYGTNYPVSDIILCVRYTDGTYRYFATPSDGVWRYCTYVTATNKTIASIGSNTYHWTTHVYVDINTFQIQEGATATEYEPYGYKIPVVSRGINLFDMAKLNATTTTVNGITFTPLDDERVHIKGKLEDTTKGATVIFNTKAKGTMPIKRGTYRTKPNNYTGSGLTVMFGINNGSTGKNINSMHTSTAIEFDGAYIGNVYLGIVAGTTTEFDDIIELQLVEGTANLPYEPYIETVTTNIYLNEPLRRIGNYADYIDFRSQEVVRNVEVIDDTGTLPLEQSLKGLDTPVREKITIPSVALNEGTNIIEVLTKVQPSKIETMYYKK